MPTPLVRAARLSGEIGADIWFKRDDLTGFGLGGNKVRALEFLIGAALDEGADTVVTGGGPQSNWVMLAALAARSVDIDVKLVYFGSPVEPAGNLALVSTLPGVEYQFTNDPNRSSVDPALEAIRAKLESLGRRPYVIGRGGAEPLGALGYLAAVDEIDRQLELSGTGVSTIWLAAGSCGTAAGLVAGHSRSGSRRHIVAVSVHRPVEECRRRIERLGEGALDLVGTLERHPVSWDVLGGQLDRSPATRQRVREAATLAAVSEGVFLDMEFAAPALAELIVAPSPPGPVVFLVSGGAPTLFTDGGLP